METLILQVGPYGFMIFKNYIIPEYTSLRYTSPGNPPGYEDKPVPGEG
jgi:hypothetical protein